MPSLGKVLAARRAAGAGSLLAYLMVGSVPAPRFTEYLTALQAAGVTGVELGFPFSDPMAEGPVIQKAAADSLAHGTHWPNLIDALRQRPADIPAAVMTYLNPILQHGVEAACRELGEAGASALILPDLPPDEVAPFRRLRVATGIDTVLLASPVSDPARLGMLVDRTSGFLYLVSRLGTTGAEAAHAQVSHAPASDLHDLIDVAHRRRPRLPVLVGFGVRTPEDVRRHRASGADGVIVGSLFQSRIDGGITPPELGRLAADLVAALA